MDDQQVRVAWLAERCAACDGLKPTSSAFCPTCMCALTIWDRNILTRWPSEIANSVNAGVAEFCDRFRAALRHLELNPQRKVKLPARKGDWPYETPEQLEAAGFRFFGHFTCAVPRCNASISVYWTPVSKVKMAVNFQDCRPHREICADPEHFKKRKEEKRAQASARRKAKRLRKGRRA